MRSLILLLAFVAAWAQAQTPEAVLVSPYAEPGYGFGFPVEAAVGPDGVLRLAVVEARRPPDRAAYLFAHDEPSGAWVLEDSIGHVAPASGNIGLSLAFVTGSEAPLLALKDAGVVVLWRRQSNAEWAVETMLEGIEKPGSGGGGLGSGLAGARLPSGEEVVFAGAQNGGDLPGPVREGSAYAFVRAPGAAEWQQEARLLAPDGREGDRFGWAVALAALADGHPGDALALVGAYSHDAPDPLTTGAVYAFRRDGATATWTFETELQPRTGPDDNGGYFGWAVAVLSEPGAEPGTLLALVGSRLGGCADTPGASGVATVFRRTPTGGPGGTPSWTEEALLCPSEPVFNSRFGSAVALDTVRVATAGGPRRSVRALVGADPFSGGQGHPGAADLFHRDPSSGAWALERHFGTGALGDWFGSSVALAGGRAFVGAHGDNTAGFDAGAVYIYDAATTTGTPSALPETEGLVLTVSPNPVRGPATVTLSLEHRQSVRVAVYDVLGRRVAVLHDGPLTAGTTRLTLSASSLAPGVYVVRVEAEAGKMARTVTVVR